MARFVRDTDYLFERAVVRNPNPPHASALIVARLPWLWQTGGNEEIARQVAEVFAYTSSTERVDWNTGEQQWGS